MMDLEKFEKEEFQNTKEYYHDSWDRHVTILIQAFEEAMLGNRQKYHALEA